MQKVIGLDIGSYSIKAVEIVNSFKTYEITNFYEKLIPVSEENPTDDVIPTCLEQLFRENNLQADRIITAMPGQYISSRIIPFTFSDPRKIQNAILSEIEDVVPFDLNDMIIDHQVLGNYQGKTMTMVVMTKKTFLKSFLDHLQRVNIDPKLVDIDSLSFYNLSGYLPISQGDCVAMVDVGHEKTSVCVVQDGILKLFRSINLGGAYISEFLARDLEVKLPEAQLIKHRVSRMLCEADKCEDLNDQDKLIAERMTLASNGLVKELGRTFYAFKTWDRTEIKRIILSGGTSRIRNFDHYLTEQLMLPCTPLRLDTLGLKMSPNLENFLPVMPQSVAIGSRAVVSIKKLSQINLRKDEFAYVQNYEQIIKLSSLVGKFLLVAMVLLSVSYGVKRIFYGSQISELEKQFQKEYGTLFSGSKKKNFNNVAFAKMRGDVKTQVQKEIEVRRTAIEDFQKLYSTSDSLMALHDLSVAIPKTNKIDVTLYSFVQNASGGGKITIKGETDGYATVASIVEAIKKTSTIKDVEEKQSGGKPGTDNKVIEFTLNMNYSPGKEGKL